MKAFRCDKCGEFFTRESRSLEKDISFDGQRGPRTLSVDLLYRCVHEFDPGLEPNPVKIVAAKTEWDKGSRRTHQPHFCDDCLLWLIEEYKGSIMVAVGSEEDVTKDSRESISNQA